MVILAFAVLVTLMVSMPGRSYSGPLPPLSERETVTRNNLRDHVSMLAGTIGQRHVFAPVRLYAAADYIRQKLAEAGYNVTEQKFETAGKQVGNLIATLEPADPTAGIVIIGAHYDTAGGTPGANDNASGVAALLELARLMKQSKPAAAGIRFVAFANEEPPFFATDKMGSRVYAKALREKGEKISGMIALETIGYFSDAEKSQHYPPGFALLYPDRGNFIGFIGNLSSRTLVRRSVITFRGSTSFPSEGCASFGWVPGVFWSDHWSFWRQGYSALMVTDTAPFRYPYYHQPGDTPDKLDYDRMARVVSGLVNVITDMVGPQ